MNTLKGSHAVHNDISQAEVIDLLWKLKQLSDSTSSPEIPYIEFNMLLADPVYRSEIIASALSANCERVKKLAQRLEHAKIEGRLINDEMRS